MGHRTYLTTADTNSAVGAAHSNSNRATRNNQGDASMLRICSRDILPDKKKEIPKTKKETMVKLVIGSNPFHMDRSGCNKIPRKGIVIVTSFEFGS
mmetsp:Transcript_15518/g.25887  ORF Transcript_15518/g.25887 Transcript_15518/m.25887 type:complete len:96 (-) Transcript_15518:365-652(-)